MEKKLLPVSKEYDWQIDDEIVKRKLNDKSVKVLSVL